MKASLNSIEGLGGILPMTAEAASHALLGILAGIAALATVQLAKTVSNKFAGGTGL